MNRAGVAVWVMVSGSVGASAFAQEGTIAPPPNFAPPSGIYSTKPDVNSDSYDMYTTKPAAPAQPQPWQQPVARTMSQDANAPFGQVQQPYAPQYTPPAPVEAQPRQVPPGNVPFGRASAEVYAPVPTGPRDVTAAPVEDIGVVSEDLAPATPAAIMTLSPKDPTEPTPQTTPIFETEGPNTVPLRHVVLTALNKVTGHTSAVEGMTGEVLRFGNLEIIAKSCRKSAASSQQDYAALLAISELKPDEASKALFSGWMYASSPSLMALEHPVYDVSVVQCAASKKTAQAKPKDKAKPKS